VSCGNATQELVTARYLRGRSQVSCIRKRSDSTEYLAMLQRHYEVDVNGKCCYEGATHQVEVNDRMFSELYLIQRGVKLFLLLFSCSSRIPCWTHLSSLGLVSL